MKLDATRIKFRWRELSQGGMHPPSAYTQALIADQASDDPRTRRHGYSGSNGNHDAVIDAICEALVEQLNEALAAATPEHLEKLLDLLITSRMTTNKQGAGP